MRWFLSLSAAVLLFPTTVLRAGSDEEYVGIYQLISDADQLRGTAQTEVARQKYAEALQSLKKLQASAPEWNTKTVQYRLTYVSEQLNALGGAPVNLDSPVVPRPPITGVAPSSTVDNTAVLKADIARLEASQASLEAKLKEALMAKPVSGDARELAKAEDKIKAFEKERDGLKSALALAQTQASAALTVTPKALPDGVSEKQAVKALEKERNELLKKLNDANKELFDAKSRSLAAQTADMTNQVRVLRSRLEVFDTRKVPYSEEELALFKASPLAVNPRGEKQKDAEKKKSVRELPSGAGPLVTEAQRAYSAGHFDDAEKKYLDVLKMDEKNVYILANLAAVNLQQNHLEDAEKRITAAMLIDPSDAYALSIKGILRYRQNNMDEALDLLSQAASADSKNAETQNYLGLVLSQKGQRGSAETALRKAVTLSPNYAGAHYNLAVVYSSAQPPSLELARFHYQKSLAAGQPKSESLEKLLEKK